MMPATKAEISLSSDNVMSVEVPSISVVEHEGQDKYPYSFDTVTSELDASIGTLSTLLVKLVKLAEVEKPAICSPTKSKRTAVASTLLNT